MATVYWAATEQDGTPLALFRAVVDDDAQTLDLERLTQDGTWLSDPTLIDELKEPEVTMVSPDDAAKIQTTLLANSDAGTDVEHDDVATAAATPPEPQQPK